MLVEFLRENSDIFAWTGSDMTGVPRKFAEQALKVHPEARPVKQGLRRFDDRRRKAIGKEIIHLLATNFIHEVIWTDWVANPVLVPKKDTEKLRMRIDYTGLNRACPKDPFALPRIDQVIDATTGSELLCFLTLTKVIIKSG